MLTWEICKTPLSLSHLPQGPGVSIFTDNNSTIVEGPVFVHPLLLYHLCVLFSDDNACLKSPKQAMAIQLAANREHHIAFHAPTGSDKSLVWMLAAQMWESCMMMVVFCPTLSLQADFLAWCQQLHINAAIWLDTHHDPGEPAILLVTPDRSQSSSFWEYVDLHQNVGRLARIIIEESHLLQTAKDYCPVMDQLLEIVEAGVPIGLISATMPRPMVPAIMGQLSITHLCMLRTNTGRLNIAYRCHLCDDKDHLLCRVLDFAHNLLGSLGQANCAIILCTSIADTEFFAKELPSCV